MTTYERTTTTTTKVIDDEGIWEARSFLLLLFARWVSHAYLPTYLPTYLTLYTTPLPHHTFDTDSAHSA